MSYLWWLLTALVAYLLLTVWGTYKGQPNRVYPWKRFLNFIFRILFLVWIMELLALGMAVTPGITSILDTQRMIQTTEIGDLIVRGIGFSYIILLLFLTWYGIYKFFTLKVVKYTDKEEAWQKGKVREDWQKIKSIFKKGEK